MSVSGLSARLKRSDFGRFGLLHGQGSTLTIVSFQPEVLQACMIPFGC